MANRLFLQDHANASKLFSFPLTKDPMIEVGSTFSTFGEEFPNVVHYLDIGTQFMAGGMGEIGKGWLGFTNLFDIKRWSKTDPVNITVDLQLWTKTDSKKDVHDAALSIMEYTMLTLEDGMFILPGMSLASLPDFQGNDYSGTSSKAKLVSLWIPGIVYIPQAMIVKSTPVFSKEITEAGFPLWAELNMHIESIFPANTEFFSTINVQQGFSNFGSFGWGIAGAGGLPGQTGGNGT